MAIPSNICVAWPSGAALPSGWTRETALDSRYILGATTGADTDLVTDRGATTHVHTSPSHTPTQNAHVHTFDAVTNPSATIVSGGTGGNAASDVHRHSGTSSATTATNNGIAITVDAAVNDLAFVEVIWIKSDGSPTTLPTTCLAFFASDSLPSGWSRVHGDRYLKGATSGGGGGGTGGSNTHTHTSPAHTHTQSGHSHTGISSGADSVNQRGAVPVDTVSSTGHTHAVSLGAATATNQSVTTVIDAANHEPPFSKLNVIQAASPTLPNQIITLWLGTNATVPTDWTRYTAMDSKWLKGAATNGEVGTLGGSSQHSHTAANCQPTQNSHTHTVTNDSDTGSTTSTGVAGTGFATPGHTHDWLSTAETATNNAITVTVDLCTVNAALPKHRTVIYVQFTGTTPPTPGPSITGRTTYDAVALNVENLYTVKDPAVTQKIWRGDHRFTGED